MSDTGDDDPRNEIVRLEAQIEELANRLEGCRKFMLGGRVAVTAGGIVLVALLIGAIEPDPRIMLAALGSCLGGFVVWGSNRSTANEAGEEMAAAERRRAALIGQIELRVVGDRPTLH